MDELYKRVIAKKAAEQKSVDFSKRFFASMPSVPTMTDVHLLKGPVSRVYLVKSFITEEEHELLLSAILDDTKFRSVVGRNVAVLGGFPVLGSPMNKLDLPFWMSPILMRLQLANVFDAEHLPNHCLMNDYEPGMGLNAHQDGPLYVPRVAILSLSSGCLFEFCSLASDDVVMSCYVPARSLLVFDQDAYLKVRHRVPFSRLDKIEPHCVNADGSELCVGDVFERGRRVSLTMRCVKDVNERFDPLMMNDADRQDLRVREASFLRSISEK